MAEGYSNVPFLRSLARRIRSLQAQTFQLEPPQALALAGHALLLRYPSLAQAPVAPEALLTPRRLEDAGDNLWAAMNCCQEALVRGGVSDGRRDGRGRLRSMRALRGIDSKVSLNQGLWSLAERVAKEETLPPLESVALTA